MTRNFARGGANGLCSERHGNGNPRQARGIARRDGREENKWLSGMD
jgi:hypothetical protein